MRRHLLLASLLATIVITCVAAAHAQSALLDLPRESQRASVSQRIGITDITIRYHRPLVKGRRIFGGLEPYGKVWRAGANENTTIEFTDPVAVEGKPLEKGVYGLHMTLTENDWTIIFSKNSTSWGSYTYDQAEDALRVTVKPQPSAMHEALTYDFDDLKAGGVTVTLRWDTLAVPFRVEVNVPRTVEQSLQNQMRGRAQYEWEAGNQAAGYLADNKLNPEQALKYVNQSIRDEERFENLMTKARILDSLDRKDEAATLRNKALPMGNLSQLHNYGRQLQQQGKQEEALAIFRTNIKKYPDSWITHSEAARLACAKGDFDTAVKEMKLSAAGANEDNKAVIEALVKRLENKEDINK